MRSVNRRDLRRSRMAAVAGLPDAPFPTTTKTRRATLFRRALVEIAERAARARRHGAAPRFASRPPPLAATWRARCGGRLGCALRVPKTPRLAAFVDTAAPSRGFERELTLMPDLRCAPSVIEPRVASKSDKPSRSLNRF